MTFVKDRAATRSVRRGHRNSTTVAVEKLLAGHATETVQKLVEGALAGDMVAIRLALDRIASARRDRPINIGLPKLTSATDARKMASAAAPDPGPLARNHSGDQHHSAEAAGFGPRDAAVTNAEGGGLWSLGPRAAAGCGLTVGWPG